MMKTCVFNADGKLINIGEWDYQIQPVQVGEQEIKVEVPDDYQLQDGEEWFDETQGQKRIKRVGPIFEDQPTNPLPDGAYVEEREVVYDEVYGWRLANAPLPITDREPLRRWKLLRWW